MITQTQQVNWIALWYDKQDQKRRMQNHIENHEMDMPPRTRTVEPHINALRLSVTKKL